MTGSSPVIFLITTWPTVMQLICTNCQAPSTEQITVRLIYPSQGHEMLFDAHTEGFRALGMLFDAHTEGFRALGGSPTQQDHTEREGV